MNSLYSDGNPIVWLAWVHFAFMLIPLVVLFMDLEWHDWRRAHPRRPSRRV